MHFWPLMNRPEPSLHQEFNNRQLKPYNSFISKTNELKK